MLGHRVGVHLDVGVLLLVPLEVHLQVALGGEAVPADVALEGPLARVCERRWICRALSLPNTLAQNLHLCLKKGPQCWPWARTPTRWGACPCGAHEGPTGGPAALAVAAMLTSGVGEDDAAGGGLR